MHIGPSPIIEAHGNDTIRIQHGGLTVCISITRFMPYFGLKGQHPLLEAIGLHLNGSDSLCLNICGHTVKIQNLGVNYFCLALSLIMF